MSKHDEELLNAIDKMINEQTFSLEAVEAIRTMRDELNACRIDIKISEKSCDDYKEKWNAVKKDYESADRALRDYEGREKELVERENKMVRMECDVEKHREIGQAYSNCFEMAFRNVTIRREAHKAMMGKAYGQDAGETPFSAPEDSKTTEE